MKHPTLKYTDGVLELLDQRQLPEQVEYVRAASGREVAAAIRDMVVRGAPAIGAAAAYGFCVAAREHQELPREEFVSALVQAGKELAASRPTAVNLFWALQRMQAVLDTNVEKTVPVLLQLLEQEAETIAREDVEINKRLARFGNELVSAGATILTHCNTGALATVGYGTALGVIREAHHSGKQIKVFANETRPRLQGANLTAFELVSEQIPATLIADSVAATLLRDGKIDLVLVGADRIAANGDTANKIGTYMLSELARRFDVPFYVAAPVSTIDFATASGAGIEIEERAAEELTHIRGIRIAPEGVAVYNPAFDVTPAANISGIITEVGVLRPPFDESIGKLGREKR
ncbi:MAG: S-methyl-5-thioribose-1-phosphate isomerase [Firmicutes bacterium]|nr:S-methyl-5-thioribose-1-phosphate isomerase [Bacillota bacterium]